MVRFRDVPAGEAVPERWEVSPRNVDVGGCVVENPMDLVALSYEALYGEEGELPEVEMSIMGDDHDGIGEVGEVGGMSSGGSRVSTRSYGTSARDRSSSSSMPNRPSTHPGRLSGAGFISEVEESLVQADRVVPRTAIAFASKASQVDVQQLKVGMKGRFNRSAPSGRRCSRGWREEAWSTSRRW